MVPTAPSPTGQPAMSLNAKATASTSPRRCQSRVTSPGGKATHIPGLIHWSATGVCDPANVSEAGVVHESRGSNLREVSPVTWIRSDHSLWLVTSRPDAYPVVAGVTFAVGWLHQPTEHLGVLALLAAWIGTSLRRPTELTGMVTTDTPRSRSRSTRRTAPCSSWQRRPSSSRGAWCASTRRLTTCRRPPSSTACATGEGLCQRLDPLAHAPGHPLAWPSSSPGRTRVTGIGNAGSGGSRAFRRRTIPAGTTRVLDQR